MKDLYVRDGRGKYRKASAGQIVDRAIVETRRVFGKRLNSTTMSTPAKAIKMLTLHMSMLKREHFLAMFLDNRHHVLQVKTMHRGTVDGVNVHPREIARYALGCNATAVIVAHNHPTGNPKPSQNDRVVTDRIRSALSILDISFLDHIIFAGGQHFSMADAGMM